MRRPSLRWMMLVPILASITVGFGAFALYIDHSERATRRDQIDTELSRADANTPPSSRPPPEAAPAPADAPPVAPTIATVDVDLPIQLTVSADGKAVGQEGAVNPFSSSTLKRLAAVDRTRTTEIENHRIRVTPLPDGQTRITALSLTSYHDAVATLRRNLAIGGVVILLLEGVIVWTLAGRLARPLETIAGAMNQIADGELDTKVDTAIGSCEVGELSTNINRMVDRLHIALDERERAATDATMARNEMQRFLADVSHEIRTPLTAFKGYSDLYEGGMLTEPGAVDRAMGRIGSESVRLHGLVNAMLDLTRGKALQHQVADVDVAGVLHAVVGDLRAAYPQRHLALHANADTVHLAGDPTRVHQAVLNLGANACVHTDPDTTIALCLRSTDDEITVSVIDHGPGIAAADLEQIFLPFYRSDLSRSRTGGSGAGLGLAVVQQIATEHHGAVTVSPTPGGGATFQLSFPRGPGTLTDPDVQVPASVTEPSSA